MTLIPDLFPKLRTKKDLVGSMPKKSRFKGSFRNQHGKCAETWLKCQRQLLYHFYWSLFRQLSYEKSLFLIWKMSKLFPNTLSADGSYSLLNRDNFWRNQFTCNYLESKKLFLNFFIAFSKSSLNFEHFRKKDDSHGWGISKITESEKQG